MPSNTTNYNIPYPIGSDPANISGDIGTVAQYIDTTLATYFATNVKKITATDYDALDRDFIISDSSLPTLIHLPLAPTEGAFIRIVNYGTALVSVDATQTLNGTTSILPQKGLMAIFTDGEWWCLPLSSSPADQPTGWQRPSDWIDVPELVQGEEVVYGIARIYSDFQNKFSMRVYGDYSVNWGDGSPIEYYLSGETATHYYDYSIIPENTLTTRGFRQCLIEVRPNNDTLTSFNASGPNAANMCRFSEVKITGPNLSNLDSEKMTFSDTISLIIKHSNTISNLIISSYNAISIIENFEGDLTNITNMSWCFAYCPKIKRVIINSSPALTSIEGIFYTSTPDEMYISDTSSVKDFGYTFSWGAVDESKIPALNTSAGKIFSYMFSWNPAIKVIPNFDMSNAMSANGMFEYSPSIEIIPALDFSKVVNASLLCRRASNLKECNIIGLGVSHSYERCDLSSTALNTIYQNLAIPKTIPIINVLYSNPYVIYYFSDDIFVNGTVTFSGFNVSEWNGQKYCYGNWQADTKTLFAYLGGNAPATPTVMGSASFGSEITVTGNYGVSNDDPSIATSKGWTVIG